MEEETAPPGWLEVCFEGAAGHGLPWLPRLFAGLGDVLSPCGPPPHRPLTPPAEMQRNRMLTFQNQHI